MFFWVANYHWLTSLLLPWASGVFGWSLWFRGWRGALLREHQNSRAGSCTCCEKAWWTCRAMLWGMNIQVFVVKTKVGRGLTHVSLLERKTWFSQSKKNLEISHRLDVRIGQRPIYADDFMKETLLDWAGILFLGIADLDKFSISTVGNKRWPQCFFNDCFPTCQLRLDMFVSSKTSPTRLIENSVFFKARDCWCWAGCLVFQFNFVWKSIGKTICGGAFWGSRIWGIVCVVGCCAIVSFWQCYLVKCPSYFLLFEVIVHLILSGIN